MKRRYLFLVLLCLLHRGSLLVAQGAKPVDFTYTDSMGRQRKLSDMHGSVVLLNFWAAWCKPCVAEIPILNAWSSSLRDSGLVVLAVNTDGEDDRDKARDIITSTPMTIPNIYDTDTTLAAMFSVTKLPVNIIIDRKGRVVEKRVGSLQNCQEVILARIKTALRKSTTFEIISFPGVVIDGGAPSLKAMADSLIIQHISRPNQTIQKETADKAGADVDCYLEVTMSVIGDTAGIDLMLRDAPTEVPYLCVSRNDNYRKIRSMIEDAVKELLRKKSARR